MANDSYTQQALAIDVRFRSRLRSALTKVAFDVLQESTGVTSHAIRLAYAQKVIGQIESYVAQLAPILVMRTNLFAATTSYDFVSGNIVTTAIDAAIESQIATDWNILAGV